MKVLGKELRVGDTLQMIWTGHTATIKEFQEYRGSFAFVSKIAVFLDGSRMSIDGERHYDRVE